MLIQRKLSLIPLITEWKFFMHTHFYAYSLDQEHMYFAECGGILNSPTGVITSPNYPQNYDHNDACAWQIIAPEGTQISVSTLQQPSEL